MDNLKINRADIVFNELNEIDMQKSKLPWTYIDTKGNVKVDAIMLAKYISSAKYQEDEQNMVEYLQVKDDLGCVTYYIYDFDKGLWRMVDTDFFKGYIYKYIPAQARNNRVKAELWSEIVQTNNWDRICRFTDFNVGIDNLINFQDGFLDLKTKTLIPHTPKIKSTIQIPCKYADIMASNGESPVFDKYMDDLCYGKPDYRPLLLEFMGAIISNIPGRIFKKSLIMKGLGDTGKSKLRSLTEYLIGKDNSTAVQFSDLNKPYEVGYLYGKRLAGHGEASDERASNMGVFKALTGGDQVSSNQKYKSKIEFVFNGLFWYNSNNYIKFDGDAGKWVYDRLIIMEFNNVIPEEKRDKELEEKMKKEKNGIMYQVLQNLYNLIDNGMKFHLNKDLPELIQECKKENSPIINFIETCFDKVDKSTKEKTLKSAIYPRYREWCTQNNYTPKSKQNFFKEIEQSITDEDGSFFCNIHGTWYVRKYRFNKHKFNIETSEGITMNGYIETFDENEDNKIIPIQDAPTKQKIKEQIQNPVSNTIEELEQLGIEFENKD